MLEYQNSYFWVAHPLTPNLRNTAADKAHTPSYWNLFACDTDYLFSSAMFMDRLVVDGIKACCKHFPNAAKL